jgi:hypothetical protein
MIQMWVNNGTVANTGIYVVADTRTFDNYGRRYEFTSFKDRCPFCCPKTDKPDDVFRDDLIQESKEPYIPDHPTQYYCPFT